MGLRLVADIVNDVVGSVVYLVIGGAICYVAYLMIRWARDWWRGGWTK